MTVTPRLDLDEEVLEKAKKAVAGLQGRNPETVELETIAFSETAELALRRHEAAIIRCLEEAGFRRQDVKRGRPRRVRRALWEHLGERGEEFDVSRIGLLRAALALLAAEYEDGSAMAAPNTTDEQGQGRQFPEE